MFGRESFQLISLLTQLMQWLLQLVPYDPAKRPWQGMVLTALHGGGAAFSFFEGHGWMFIDENEEPGEVGSTSAGVCDDRLGWRP